MTDLFRRFDGYGELGDLCDAGDEEVLVRLGQPALVRIPGTDPSPAARVISCLLHGNEDSGYRAVLDVLRARERHPFDLWVFIGNVRAASQEGWFAHRYLEGQEDFNRVWGLGEPTTRMRRCADEVLAILCEQPLEAGVDLHNNTGENPFYAVLPRHTPETVHLGATCVDTALLWLQQSHTMMEGLSAACPTVAIECGLPGIPAHADFAREAVRRFLAMDDLDQPTRVPERVFEIEHRVVVRPEVPFAFGGVLNEDVELVLHPGLDGSNFGMILAGTEVGVVQSGASMPLLARDRRGADVTDRYFGLTPDGGLVALQDFTPVMMTTTVMQARRDCLTYIARRRR